MNTILIIFLASIVVGFLYRGMKLLHLIKCAVYCSNLSKETTPAQAELQGASVGCLSVLCLPFICLFFVVPVFLLIKVDWWIPIVSFIIGLTIVNMIGYIIERILQLPNHQSFGSGMVDLNAIELSVENSLYRRTLGLMLFYNAISLVVSLFILFGNY